MESLSVAEPSLTQTVLIEIHQYLTQKTPYLAEINYVLEHYQTDISRSFGIANNAQLVLLNPTIKALAFIGVYDNILLVHDTVSDTQHLAEITQNVIDYANQTGKQAFFLSEQTQSNLLAKQGYAINDFGVMQRIHGIDNFSIKGNAKRRLRYAYHKFQQNHAVSLVYTQYKKADVYDQVIDELINKWIELKGRTPGFKAGQSNAILPLCNHQVVLAYSGKQPQLAIFYHLLPSSNTVMMDLEFYSENSVYGCMEYTIVELMKKYAQCGYKTFSLGTTYVTAVSNECGDQHRVLWKTIRKVHQSNFHNGDSNYQFKAKFRGSESRFNLCVPHSADSKSIISGLMQFIEQSR